ncbi:MAG: hypothetical protein U0U70_14775 [Chitinophagaceae bacterium]
MNRKTIFGVLNAAALIASAAMYKPGKNASPHCERKDFRRVPLTPGILSRPVSGSPGKKAS